MAKDDSPLENLKKEYLEIQKKYDLPDFKEFNEDFYIEKISEHETNLLIREIKRFMAEKFSNYLRFVETILNPVNAPMFVFSFVRSVTNEDKKKLSEIYKVLSKIELQLIELDLFFDEKKEVTFIKDSFKTWKEIKKDLLDVVKAVEKNWGNKFEGDGKGYFG